MNISLTPVLTPPHSNARNEILRMQKEEPRLLQAQATLPNFGEVWDYSFARPTLQGSNIKGVCRYLDFLPNGKVLNKPELDYIISCKKVVLPNWENGATDMRGGWATGIIHGHEANKQLDALNWTKYLPIVYSADWDVQPSEYNAIEQYLRAATTQGKPAGIYGKNAMVHEMLRRGAAVIGWVTIAWLYGQQVSPLAHLFQDGVNSPNGTDHNIILKPDWGFYPPVTKVDVPINDKKKVELDMGNPSTGLFQPNQIDTFWVNQKGSLIHHWYFHDGPFGPDPSGWNHEILVNGLQPLSTVLGPLKWEAPDGDGYIHIYALSETGEQIEVVWNMGDKNAHWTVFNQGA